MQFFIFVLLICLFIFLYCVHVLANDDFIFLRRDVTMEKLFNLIFLGAFVSLFFSRLFYAFSAQSILANPFVFLLIPYFPGLSLLGGVVGAGAYSLFLAWHRGPLPLGRMFDFFSISFLISLPLGFLGYLMFSQGASGLIKFTVQAGVYFILFIIFLKFFLPKLLSGKLKEGTISLIFLVCFSVASLTANAFAKITLAGYFNNFENIILILILLSSTAMLVWHENLLSKIERFKKEK